MHGDVVIVGGGVAGSALALVLARRGASVTVLERQQDYADRVRGEYVHPWGVAEAQQLGLVDILLAARGVFVTRGIGYDESIPSGAAEARARDVTTMVPGVAGGLGVGHPAACCALSQAAEAAGARYWREQARSALWPERTRLSRSRRTAACNRSSAAWWSALTGGIQRCVRRLESSSGVLSRLTCSPACSSVMYRSGRKIPTQRLARARSSARSSPRVRSACVSTPPQHRISAVDTTAVPPAGPVSSATSVACVVCRWLSAWPTARRLGHVRPSPGRIHGPMSLSSRVWS